MGYTKELVVERIEKIFEEYQKKNSCDILLNNLIQKAGFNQND